MTKEKPEDFVKRHILEEAYGQWGLAYNDLLPQQQAIISRAQYVGCGAGISIPELTDIAIVRVYTETIPTPGEGDIDSTAITIRVTFQKLGSEVQTVHAYSVAGAWRASVDQPTFDAESMGQCVSRPADSDGRRNFTVA